MLQKVVGAINKNPRLFSESKGRVCFECLSSVLTCVIEKCEKRDGGREGEQKEVLD